MSGATSHRNYYFGYSRRSRPIVTAPRPRVAEPAFRPLLQRSAGPPPVSPVLDDIKLPDITPSPSSRRMPFDGYREATWRRLLSPKLREHRAGTSHPSLSAAFHYYRVTVNGNSIMKHRGCPGLHQPEST